MSTMEFIGQWRRQISSLIQKFGLLTGNDRTFEKGVKEEMFATLQVKQGRALSKFTSI